MVQRRAARPMVCVAAAVAAAAVGDLLTTSGPSQCLTVYVGQKARILGTFPPVEFVTTVLRKEKETPKTR